MNFKEWLEKENLDLKQLLEHPETLEKFFEEIAVLQKPKWMQKGSVHYKTVIEPLQYIIANDLGFCEGNIVKYITRHNHIEAKEAIKSLQKVIHYAEVILEETYGVVDE